MSEAETEIPCGGEKSQSIVPVMEERLVLQTCYRTKDSGTIGECCIKKPVLECDPGYSCNLPHQCVETPSILANNPVRTLSVSCMTKRISTL